MAQHDFNIDNQSAPAFRGDLNNALEALGTLSSGATAPATTYAGMIWHDTAANTLYIRSDADDAWIALGTLDQSANTFAPAGVAELTQVQAEDDTSTVFGQVSGERLAQAVAVNTPPAGLTLINTTVITGSPTVVDFTAFDATLYASYIFILEGVKIPTATADLWLRSSSDGGVTFDNGTSDYVGFGSFAGDTSDAATAQVELIGSAQDDYGVLGRVEVLGAGNTSARTSFTGYAIGSDGGVGDINAVRGDFIAVRNESAVVDAIRFQWDGGDTFAAGTIRMYGVRL